MATDAPPAGDFTPNADRVLAGNESFAGQAHDPEVPGAPRLRLAVVICMDCRIDPLPTLGLANGDAHVIRNAGGIVTDDAIRSLCLSQRALGTREIILVHHTDCGLGKVDEAALRAELIDDVGVAPTWSFEAFDDPHDSVRHSMQRLRLSPFVAHTDHVRGFVYDVADGRLREVE